MGAGAEVTTQAQPDASWAALADLDDAPRQEAMLARFRSLEDASEGDRASGLAAMVAAEDAMTDEGIATFDAFAPPSGSVGTATFDAFSGSFTAFFTGFFTGFFAAFFFCDFFFNFRL